MREGSAHVLSKVRGFSRPHAREPQTSEKRGLRYSLERGSAEFALFKLCGLFCPGGAP